MKKAKKTVVTEDEMCEEYDFSGGVRGKYYRNLREGYTVTVNRRDGTTLVQNFKLEDGAVRLDRDVQEFFPDSESVNNALRGLIALLPQKTRKTKLRERAAA